MDEQKKKAAEERAERRRLRERRKRIKEVNGFYAETERGARIHKTKIKGRYL